MQGPLFSTNTIVEKTVPRTLPKALNAIISGVTYSTTAISSGPSSLLREVQSTKPPALRVTELFSEELKVVGVLVKENQSPSYHHGAS